ncbi:MAG TPA: DUF3179 domain-containing (seleno)protein [Tepidisphaeraceae bacterium]|jgi:hypothetical protein
MILPILIILIALLAAGWVAYGTVAGLGVYPQGVQWIVWSRTLQWPLVAVAIICSIALIGLVISGKRRAWWLIGLAPVLALFVHRFANSPMRNFAILDNPAFVGAEVAAISDDDFVVGLVFANTPYAYPYSALYSNPVIIQSDQTKRMMLIWSAFANRAVAANIDREFRARELEIVSMPANALLLYDSRSGQFINGVTGARADGSKVIGFYGTLAVTKTTWKNWRALHPGSKALAVAPLPSAPATPAAPILPVYPMKPQPGGAREMRIIFIPATQPAAIAEEQIGVAPLNLTAGDVPLLLFREKESGMLRAFDRRVDKDLIPRFRLNTTRRPGLLIDADTNSTWSAGGVVVDGSKEMKGRKLTAVAAEEELFWGVMKNWYPTLQLLNPPVPANPNRPGR